MAVMKSPIAQTSIPAMESKTIEINSRAFPSTSVIRDGHEASHKASECRSPGACA